MSHSGPIEGTYTVFPRQRRNSEERRLPICRGRYRRPEREEARSICSGCWMRPSRSGTLFWGEEVSLITALKITEIERGLLPDWSIPGAQLLHFGSSKRIRRSLQEKAHLFNRLQ